MLRDHERHNRMITSATIDSRPGGDANTASNLHDVAIGGNR